MIHRSKLAQIHIARQQLGLSDDDYRALLGRVAGVNSAKELTNRNVGAVINEFQRLGWKPAPAKRAGRKPNTLSKETMLTKVEAQLADMGLSWQYAESIAKRQSGIQKMEWVRDYKALSAVIAALEVEQHKRSLAAALDHELLRTGMAREDLTQHYTLPSRWERNIKVLEQLIEHLQQKPTVASFPAGHT